MNHGQKQNCRSFIGACIERSRDAQDDNLAVFHGSSASSASSTSSVSSFSMRYSQLFGKTSKTAPHDAESVNARLLCQAGFIDQVMAGVYSYLPLGLLVLKRIQQIVREEMDMIGGQEILMPALHPKELWAATGRWEDPGSEVMFQLKGRGGKEYGLGWTHEEVVTPLAKRFIKSYRDLPLAVYQVQDKFRNEPRAKSGLLRAREFSMKDLYSFHADTQSLEQFYEQATQAYLNVFQRCGLDVIVTEASGGAFSKYSHEFQVLTPFGEDHIFVCDNCRYAQNRDIAEVKVSAKCPKCKKGKIEEKKAIEVGNIFKLGTRFSDACALTYTDAKGKKHPVIMGCYGIGPSRIMGAVVEVHHDDAGILWPPSIAPYHVHLLALGSEEEVRKAAEKLYKDLTEQGIDVLYDDRPSTLQHVQGRPERSRGATGSRSGPEGPSGPRTAGQVTSAGEKFADADLIGIPHRLIVSKRSLEKGGVEVKERVEKEGKVMKAEKVLRGFGGK